MIEAGTLASSESIARMATGFFLTAVVSAAALRLKALSRSGAAGSLLVGTIAFGGGWGYALTLFAFFISATCLSRFRKATKEARTSRIVEKGGQRDGRQVFANGGVFAGAVLWMIVSPNSVAAFMAIGAVAGAASDTWATEIGSLATARPRLILTGKQVQPGTSGGVTLQGSLAALAGAGFIAGIAQILLGFPGLFPAAIVGGVSGALVDSMLGTLLQSRRWCERCGEFTERPIHSCGSETTAIGGVAWMNNDAVNFFCTLAAAGVAALWVL